MAIIKVLALNNKNATWTSIAIALMIAMFYVIAILLFVLTPFMAANWAASPFPGFVVEQTLVVTGDNGLNWLGHSLGIDHPQRLVELDDIPISTANEYQSLLANYPFGQVISLVTQMPDGTRYTFKGVAFEAFPFVDFMRLFILPYLVGLVYLGIGLWVLSQRWQTSPGRAFAFVCVWAAIVNVLLFDLITTHLLASVWSVGVAMIGGGLIYLALQFPEPVPFIRRYPALLLLSVAGSVGLMVWSLLVVNSYQNPWSYIDAWRASYVYAAFGILFFLVVMFYRTRSTTDDTQKQQARITLWGALFSFLPIGLWFTAPLVNIHIPWNPAVFLPLLLIFPASIGLAILRYRLWDLDVLINRTVVYGTLTVLLLLIYSGIVVVLERLFSSLTAIQTAASGALSTLVIVLIFDPLRNRVQTFIDRRFFRQRYDMARTLTAFTEVVRDEVSLDSLKDKLTKVIQETMDPVRVEICNCLDVDKSPTLKLLEQDPFREYLTENKEAVLLEKVNFESPALQQLRQDGTSVIVPLVHQNELLGIINLGARRNEKTYTSDDRRLLAVLASQVAPAMRVSRLVEAQQMNALQRERIDQEMKVASLVQQTLMARNPPEIPGWEIKAHYQPARAVGGDFYDFMPLQDGRLVVATGDVTDKGIPAALIMATTRSVLRGTARRMLPPGVALGRSNNILVPEMLPNMFVTCFYAIIELDSGRIQFANAGHNPPCHHNGGAVRELYATGMPLGLMEGMEYDEKEDSIQPGESLLLYSDGITEAHNSQREMFGFGRLKSLICELEKDEDLISRLLEQVKAFCGEGAEQEDDITLVYIKRK